MQIQFMFGESLQFTAVLILDSWSDFHDVDRQAIATEPFF